MSAKLKKCLALVAGLGVVLSWPGCLSPGRLTQFGSPSLWGAAPTVIAGNAADCVAGGCDGGPLTLEELLDPIVPDGGDAVVGQ